MRLDPQLAITMIDRTGRRTRLSCPSLPAPLHLVAGVLEWEALSWRDRLSVLGMATPLKHARRELQPGATMKAASPDETVENWLIRNGQTPRLRELLWDPLALAALNQPPEQAAAPPFARVLAEMFSDDPRAAAIALPTKPLHLMYAEPARAYLEAHGGAVRTGAAATIALTADRGAVAGVRVGGETWPADRVISSVPWFALAGLFDEAPPALHGVLDRARADGVVADCDRQSLVRSAGARPAVCRPARAGDAVGVRQTARVRPPPRRRRAAVDASHLSLVSSGAADILAETNVELIHRAHDELLDALPDVRAANCCERPSSANRARRSRSRPASRRVRSTETDLHGFLLAGDWTATGLPATIESAVRSGHRAAERCIG